MKKNGAPTPYVLLIKAQLKGFNYVPSIGLQFSETRRPIS